MAEPTVVNVVGTVALDDVLDVFDHVDGPVVLSADVVDALGCTTETARRKLKQLHEQGDLDRRKVARRVLYWRATEPTPSQRRETVETPVEGTTDQSDSPPAPDEQSPSPVNYDAGTLEQSPSCIKKKLEQSRNMGLFRTFAHINDRPIRAPPVTQ